MALQQGDVGVRRLAGGQEAVALGVGDVYERPGLRVLRVLRHLRQEWPGLRRAPMIRLNCALEYQSPTGSANATASEIMTQSARWAGTGLKAGPG